jgi:hypothetical protein
LRYQRGDITAGFSLFSAECWFHHSYDPATVKPYHVYHAVKHAFAPVGLALETTQRRFYGGDAVKTNVFITNDDEQFRSLENLKLIAELCEDIGSFRVTKSSAELGDVAHLPYYATVKVPAELKLPTSDQPRDAVILVMRLMHGEQEISRTEDLIELFAKPTTTSPAAAESVVVIRRGEALGGLAQGGGLRSKIAAGATAIVLSPANNEIAALFPNAIYDDAKEAAASTRRTTTRRASTRAASAPATEKKAETIEFADLAPCVDTKLSQNLEPMDLKWWARKGDWRAFIGSSSVRLRPGGGGRELVRYIPAHGYIPPEKLPEQYRTVLCEIPIGKGRLWICGLDIDASMDVDPAARIFADNLFRAAADPQSTRDLPKVPTHDELLKGSKP